MILAVDTSCYTTSLTVINLKGDIVFESMVLLKVKEGSKGLRQSEGFYQHVYALNKAFNDFTEKNDPADIKAIACSVRPRDVEGSYMPVFEAGRLFCDNLSKALKVPMYTCSHQVGHIMAALHTIPFDQIPKTFYAMHLSGGTTEWMACSVSEDQVNVKLLGETLDISFGQLVDRIGVETGFAFPAGQALDIEAQQSSETGCFKIKMKNNQFNLSGYENKYKQMLENKSIKDVSRHLFNTLANLMTTWIESVPQTMPIIIAGGVASNSIINKVLSTYNNVYFAAPKYAKDNALGVAFLGLSAYEKEQQNDKNESVLSI